MTYQPLYLDEYGTELSGASVAVNYLNHRSKSKSRMTMYIGQVFEPFLLKCVKNTKYENNE